MKKLLIAVLIIAALLASACISDESAPAEEPAENTSQQNISQIDAAPLIPREVFFGNPDKITVRLSPDGTRISYLPR